MKPGQTDSRGRRYGFKLRRCPVCGTEFWPSNGIQKFCSPPCMNEGQRVDATCEFCAGAFQYVKGDRKRFCSPLCANRSTGRQRAETLRKHKPHRDCEQCGVEFEVRRLGQRWCSQQCYGISRRGQARVPKVKHLSGWGLRYKGETYCRNCGAVCDHLHHIVPRSKSLAGEADLRNGLPLCIGCHRGWHDRRVTIPLWRLKPDELAYAVELTNAVWVERNYPPNSLPEEVEFVREQGGVEPAWLQMTCWLGREYAEVIRTRRPQGETVNAYLERRALLEEVAA